MSYENLDSDKYQKVRHHSQDQQNSIQSEESSSSSIYSTESRNHTNVLDHSPDSKILSAHPTPDIIPHSLSDTKSVLIQRILDSIQSPSSASTTNTSLSSIPCQSENFSNQISLHFPNGNQLGIKPCINDLLEIVDCAKQCSCHQVEIRFHNSSLNQQLSSKYKQSILRLVLRRQQIFDRYFSS